MADRLKGVWVAFEQDIREDDAEPIINAIKALRGVVDVRGVIADPTNHFARLRIRTEFGKELRALTDRLLLG